MTRSLALLVSVLSFVAPGCADDRDPGDSGPPRVDSGPPPGDAGDACGFYAGLDRSCSTDADCVAVIHAADCCGTSVSRGIAASALASFDSLEPVCAASYPACGCPAGPTVTDSGEPLDLSTTAEVACVPNGPSSQCMTYVTMRPPGAP